MKTFCSNCGTPIEYASKRPNFCPSCGSSLGGVAKQPSPTHQQTNSYQDVEVEAYSTNYQNKDIDLSQIQVDFSFIKKGVPIESVIGSSPLGDINRPKKSKKEIKEFFESMKTLKRHDLGGGDE